MHHLSDAAGAGVTEWGHIRPEGFATYIDILNNVLVWVLLHAEKKVQPKKRR